MKWPFVRRRTHERKVAALEQMLEDMTDAWALQVGKSIGKALELKEARDRVEDLTRQMETACHRKEDA